MTALATFADDILALTINALNDLSDEQRRAYELTHGIDATGQTERGPLDNQTVADILGVSRSTIRWNLAQAERTVYRAIALHLLDAERLRIDENEMPCPGESLPEMSSRFSPTSVTLGVKPTRAGTGGTILGEGSERHVREAKRSDAKGRTAALIQAHRDCIGATA